MASRRVHRARHRRPRRFARRFLSHPREQGCSATPCFGSGPRGDRRDESQGVGASGPARETTGFKPTSNNERRARPESM
jgi:hypothetical protein